MSGHSADLALLLIRVWLGVVFLAHGYNHIFRGGRIRGTARWFESLGMQPGIVHAWTASLTELACGAMLVLGLLTPLACAGVVGTMTVAWLTNHLRNGFFIFRPGEGYEYVVTLIVVGAGLGTLGAGEWSIDGAANWFESGGWGGFVIAAGAGLAGALTLLALCWRPNATEASAERESSMS